MTVSATAAATGNINQPSGATSTFRQDLGQLVSALNSGDLPGAQQAFSTLSQLQGSNQGPTANAANPLSQALSQIGQALQSGNLSAAQQALSSLQQPHRGHHHHGHHAADNSATSTSTANPTSASGSSGTSVDITA